MKLDRAAEEHGFAGLTEAKLEVDEALHRLVLGKRRSPDGPLRVP